MVSRYQQLKKENDQTISYLGNSYQRIALIYTKKARGYAVNGEDTEVKIRDVLNILKEYDESRVPIAVAIPNESAFIEGKVKLLSKKYKDPDRIKGIIWLTIIIVGCIAWVAVGKYFSRAVTFDAPDRFHVSKTIENNVTLTWREVSNASEYVIYYVVDGDTSSQRTVSQCEYTFTLEYGKTYTFYLYTKENSVIGSSEKVSVTYTLEE